MPAITSTTSSAVRFTNPLVHAAHRCESYRICSPVAASASLSCSFLARILDVSVSAMTSLCLFQLASSCATSCGHRAPNRLSGAACCVGSGVDGGADAGSTA
eukprot:172654-Prymnesium_polylepis.2